jgi:type VI secretion system secreted protein VgrG
MRSSTRFLFVMTSIAGFSAPALAAISLGTAGNFAVLAGSTVTNTGFTVVNGGDIGVSPSTAITGFTGFGAGGPGILTPPYTFDSGDAVAAQAQTDLTTAFNAAAALPFNQDLTGDDLGGRTLLPGVYFFSSSASLTGTLTLNDNGNPNAQFVFQIGSALTANSNSTVVTINGGTSPAYDIFWQVGSSATLDTGTAFEGNILAYSSITLDTGSSLLDGRALAETAAVNLQDNAITTYVPTTASATPLPSSLAGGLVLIGLLAAGAAFKKSQADRAPQAIRI